MTANMGYLNIYRNCDLFGFGNVKNQRGGNHALCYILIRRIKWDLDELLVLCMILGCSLNDL